MGQIKFGRAQLKNPTPANWSAAISVSTVILGAVIAWLGTATFIPVKVSTVLQSILGLLLTVANGLKPFIGVETTKKSIPVEDVSSMEVDDSKNENNINNNLKKTTT